jgi:hypothetical protein
VPGALGPYLRAQSYNRVYVHRHGFVYEEPSSEKVVHRCPGVGATPLLGVYCWKHEKPLDESLRNIGLDPTSLAGMVVELYFSMRYEDTAEVRAALGSYTLSLDFHRLVDRLADHFGSRAAGPSFVEAWLDGNLAGSVLSRSDVVVHLNIEDVAFGIDEELTVALARVFRQQLGVRVSVSALGEWVNKDTYLALAAERVEYVAFQSYNRGSGDSATRITDETRFHRWVEDMSRRVWEAGILPVITVPYYDEGNRVLHPPEESITSFAPWLRHYAGFQRLGGAVVFVYEGMRNGAPVAVHEPPGGIRREYQDAGDLQALDGLFVVSPQASLEVRVVGLPVGAVGAVDVRGPGGFGRWVTQTTILTVPSGTYQVSAWLAGAGLYSPTPAWQEVAIAPGATRSVTVTYTPSSLVNVTVTPTSVSLSPGRQQVFTATVTGAADLRVAWLPPSCGTIAALGNTATFTAGNLATTCFIVATSLADTSRSAVAFVTVTAPQVVSVSITPSSVSLPVNGTQSFTATVTGASNTGVTWSATCGALSGSGNTRVFTAPSTARSCTVRATSDVDTSKSSSASVVVNASHFTWRIGTDKLFLWSTYGGALHLPQPRAPVFAVYDYPDRSSRLSPIKDGRCACLERRLDKRTLAVWNVFRFGTLWRC